MLFRGRGRGSNRGWWRKSFLSGLEEAEAVRLRCSGYDVGYECPAAEARFWLSSSVVLLKVFLVIRWQSLCLSSADVPSQTHRLRRAHQRSHVQVHHCHDCRPHDLVLPCPAVISRKIRQTWCQNNATTQALMMCYTVQMYHQRRSPILLHIPLAHSLRCSFNATTSCLKVKLSTTKSDKLFFSPLGISSSPHLRDMSEGVSDKNGDLGGAIALQRQLNGTL